MVKADIYANPIVHYTHHNYPDQLPSPFAFQISRERQCTDKISKKRIDDTRS